MTFKSEQIAALINLGVSMVVADGKVAEEESATIYMKLTKFGVKADDIDKLYTIAHTMSHIEVLTIVSAMTDEQKKHASSFLAAIIVADGEIDDSEVKLWQLICTLGQFPAMTIKDAILFWNNN